MVPMKDPSLFKQPAHRFGAFVEAGFGRGGFGHHDDVCVADKLGAVGSIKFAQVPLYAVAHDRAPNLSRYGKAEFPALPVPPGHVANIRPRCVALPFAKNGRIRRTARKTLFAGKCLRSRHNWIFSSLPYADSRLRPRARRRLMMFRPPGVAIRARNP
jgi:hypothetical protein